ncbi:MAG: hypothetical protein JWQ09_1453, partial [Segetibacter sp.]|nr:hypothetical protein [Segetibacter sp.]
MDSQVSLNEYFASIVCYKDTKIIPGF